MTLTPNELPIEAFSLKKAALTFRAINNRVRLQILRFLHENKSMTVTALYEKLQMDQSATSQHLAILRKGGFVNTKREGKCIYYAVNYERLKQLHDSAKQLVVETKKEAVETTS